MANPIIRIKRSSVPGKIPNASQVPLGEIALNTYDGKVFASRNVGIGTTVFVVNPWTVGTGTDTYNTYFTEGNVGIGSTIPAEKLDVLGNVNISGIITTSAISVGSTLTHTGTTASLNNTTAANTLNLATGATGSEVLKTINVGTGGAAGSRLLVNIGSATAGTASTVVVNSGTNVLIGAATTTGTTSQPLQVTGGAYVSGNLGVGATNPSDKLHVLSGNIRVDSTIGALTFWSGAGFFGGIGMAQAFGGSGTDLNLRSDTNRNIIFQTGGANERVRITSTGNVGIGTTNPSQTLDVNGNVRIRSGLYDSRNQVGAAGSVLVSTGTGVSWTTPSSGSSGSGGLNWTTKTTTYTAVNRDAIIADTTGGSFTINLPATPSTGDYIVISDGADWETNNLIVGRNGSTIEGTAEDLTLDIGGLYVNFVYDGSTWEVYPSVGQGIQGTSGFDGSTIPGISTTSSYILSVNDVGQHVAITTGGVTVPANVFSSGDAVMIINDSATQQTITSGVGITMYLAGTALTGNRFLGQRGLANILCFKPNVFTIVGAGLT
jgi:hypothetical protein